MVRVMSTYKEKYLCLYVRAKLIKYYKYYKDLIVTYLSILRPASFNVATCVEGVKPICGFQVFPVLRFI